MGQQLRLSWALVHTSASPASGRLQQEDHRPRLKHRSKKRSWPRSALLLSLLLFQKSSFRGLERWFCALFLSFPYVAGSAGNPLSNPPRLLSIISLCFTCVLQGSRGQFGRCETAVRFCWRRGSHTYTGRSYRNPPRVVSGPTRCRRNYCIYCICASFLHAFS